MKHITLLLFVLGMSFVHQTAMAQLDTLFFEGFDDNRNKWREYADETGSMAIKDGFLEVENLVGRGTYRLNWMPVPLPTKDTFLYEIKMQADGINYGGAAYNINFIPRKKQDQRVIFCCYTGIVVTKKALQCIDYRRSDGFSINKQQKIQDLDRKNLTFQVTYGSGKYYCYVNGKLLISYRYNQSRQKGHENFAKWGWMTAGKANFKVDYMLVMGK